MRIVWNVLVADFICEILLSICNIEVYQPILHVSFSSFFFLLLFSLARIPFFVDFFKFFIIEGCSLYFEEEIHVARNQKIASAFGLPYSLDESGALLYLSNRKTSGWEWRVMKLKLTDSNWGRFFGSYIRFFASSTARMSLWHTVSSSHSMSK